MTGGEARSAVTHLVLTDDYREHHAVLRLGASGEALTRAPDIALWHSAKRASRRDLVAGTDGRRLALTVRTTAEGQDFSLIVLDLETGGLVAQRIFATPEVAALSMRGERVLVGESGQVRMFAIDAPEREPEVVASLGGGRRKPYDHFAWVDDDLLALDDMVAPIFADWLHAPAGHAVAVRRSMCFPTIIGHYGDVVLQRAGGGSPTAYALALTHSSIGIGQEIMALRLARLPERTGSSDDYWYGGKASIREFDPEGGDGIGLELKLLAGDRFTRMRAIALTPDARALVVAATERGILRVTLPLSENSRVNVLETELSCSDVIAVDGRLFALLRDEANDSTTVLELRVDGAAVIGATRVTGRFSSFVR